MSDGDKTLPAKPATSVPQGKDSWQAKLLEYAHQLTVLKVLTYIGNAEVELDPDGLIGRIQVTDGGKSIVTVLNLVGGDITNVIPDEVKNDTGLRDFHASQVEKASAVLPNNLRLLGEFIDKIFD